MRDAHFYLHQNPCQKTLVDRLVEQVSAESKGDVFYEPRVLVRNQGMATWIRQQIASSSQISMGVDFPQPNAFLQDVMKAESVSLEELLWRIYKVLPYLERRKDFNILREYLEDGDASSQKGLKRYQLASKLAALYDKYLLYRPEWITAWNSGQLVTDKEGHELWQRELWKVIGGPSLSHWALRLSELDDQLDKKKLPKAVHAFGASNFAPAYLNFLYMLSRQVKVHLYWLNPVDGYWGDGQSKRDWVLKNTYAEEVDPFAHNPLISTYGRMGREYIHNIYGGSKEEFLVQEEEFPFLDAHQPPENRLCAVQYGLKCNELPEARGYDDDSISIHACHSPLREVQTLKNYLLGLSTEGPLDIGNVLVMCTDIQTYAPAIEAVFGSHNQSAEKKLPFRVADRSSAIHNPNIAIIPQLLGIRSSRFTNQEALRILQTPAILERFNLSKEDVRTITHWIDQNGIRWGFNAAHIQQQVGRETQSYWSWEEGLERMLLGMTMPGQGDEALWNGVSPFTEIEGGGVRLLAALCDFVAWCKRMFYALGEEHTLAEWIDLVRSWIREGFSEEDEVKSQLFPFFKALESFEQSGEFLEDTQLPASVFTAHLSEALEAEGAPFGFLAGSITFCEMKPMRSIPMDTICIMGMSYDAFPRASSDLQFDLMRDRRMEGDRSTRDDDLYLFLETLISVKKNLFISYVGYSIKDGTKLPPSTTLQTLLDHTAGLEACVHEEKLHPFDPEYFDQECPVSFDALSMDAAKAVRGLKTDAVLPIFQVGGESPDETTVDAFISVMVNPCKHFLTHVLQAKLQYADTPVDENELLELDGLKKWQIRNDLLHHETDPSSRIKVLQQKSQLPPALLGEEVYQRVYKEASALKEVLPEVTLENVSVECLGVQISGQVPVSRMDGSYTVVLSSVSNARAKEKLRLRCLQLLLSVALKTPVSAQLYFLDQKKSPSVFQIEGDSEFLCHTQQMVELYKEAFQRPLPHFPKTAEAYWAVSPGKEDDEAQLAEKRRLKALTVWNSSYDSVGEGEDEEIRRFFQLEDPVTEEFYACSERIWASLCNLSTIKKG